MPSGVGAVTVANDPSAQGIRFVPDPEAFFAQTERNEYVATSFAAPGSGATERRSMPQNGILSKITIVFIGTLDVTMGGGSVTTCGPWPYGLLDQVTFDVNAQNALMSVDGDDLIAHAQAKYPGFKAGDTADTYPGTAGAGNAISADGDVVLTWELPINVDDVTNVGAIYAQSPAMNLSLAIRQAVTTDLLTAAGGASLTLTGTFYVMTTVFDIPMVGDANTKALIVPDVSRLHGLQAYTVPITAVGETRAPLIRHNAQLVRLFAQVYKDAPKASTTDHYLLAANDADELAGIRIEYGASNRPLDYSIAHLLAARNVKDYRAELHKGYLCFDFMADNPARDAIMMGGVTELALIPTVNSGVTLGSGAKVRIVQETLFA